MIENHPGDHNVLADNITDIVTELGNDPKGSYPTVQARLEDLDSIIPVGTIWEYAGQTAPAGWLICDGTSVSNTTYPALWQTIGTTYGGAGSSFNLPNLDGRSTIGGAAPGATGGSANSTVVAHSHNMSSHTHNIPNHAHTMAHNHPAGTTSNDTHGHSYSPAVVAAFGTGSLGFGSNVVGTPLNLTTGTAQNDSHTHSFDVANYSGNTGNPTSLPETGAPSNNNTNSAGSSGTGQNYHPYLTLLKIIKF